MPFHDFKCECGNFFSQYQAQNALSPVEECQCGLMAKKVWSSSIAAVRVFKPQWFEHIDTQPIFIESKSQLKKECEKRGLASVYVENSFNRSF